MNEWLVVLIKSLILFFLALVLIRVKGKRSPTKITPFNHITYSVIAILVVETSVNTIKNWVIGITALAVWIIIPIALEYLSMKSKMIYELMYGKEVILIKDGKVMEENLGKLRLTGQDLLRELRLKDAFNLADVEFAIMETTGDINVILKSDKKPITPHDLGRKVAPQSAPQTIILDGNILDEPLSNMGLNRGWLKVQLENIGVTLENVFIGQVDSSGDLYLDLFDDVIELPQPKVKEMLYASIEKTQADLLSFSLETENMEAKTMYAINAKKLKKVMEKLEPYLLR